MTTLPILETTSATFPAAWDSRSADASLAAWWRDRSLWKAVLVPFTLSRALLFFLGILAVQRFPISPTAINADSPGLPLALRIWVRWDTLWYARIVWQGYSFHPGQESNVAFFPLYPTLMRLGTVLFGLNSRVLVISGLVISNVALLVALILLYFLTRKDLGEASARRACWYLCIFPSTLFLGAVYPMSLGLALSLGAYAAAQAKPRGMWWLAGALGGLAALSRAEGALLLLPLLGEFWTARRNAAAPEQRPRFVEIFGLALIPLAVSAWCGYLWYRFGDPLAFHTTLAYWSRGDSATPEGHARFLLDCTFLVYFLALVPLCWRRLRVSYALHASIYSLLLLGLAITGTVSFCSCTRYGLNLFPELMILAALGRRTAVHETFIVISTALASLFMILFALFYWVA